MGITEFAQHLLAHTRLVWQAGQHAAPLSTDPWRLPPACPKIPAALCFAPIQCECKDVAVLCCAAPRKRGMRHPFRSNEMGDLAAAWGWRTRGWELRFFFATTKHGNSDVSAHASR